MYLEKLEIQGFKSFANKNILKFPGSTRSGHSGVNGITAIVGPNGSGKSNIADAVRWVLGEQSVKLLRGKKSEDVIFSGSAKKSSLSLAEVSLYLNNSDPSFALADAGATEGKAILYREIVVTRRLYRDGESEYLLNGSRVRLLDISLLLAKAKFGQRAYSVIGQGMVENFLNTSMLERKEFFDEATGVRIYQIKRDDSMNKLKNARDNLGQAASLLFEIEPRMRSLTRQMKKLEQREGVVRELGQLQRDYYASQWHKLNGEIKEINAELLKKEQLEREQKSELDKVNQALAKYQAGQLNLSGQEKLAKEKKELEVLYQRAGQNLAEIKAKIGISLEIGGRVDMSWLVKRGGILKEEIKDLEKEIKEAEDILESDRKELLAIKKERDEFNRELFSLRQKLSQLQKDDDGDEIIKKARAGLDELLRLSRNFFSRLEKGEPAGKLKQEFFKLSGKLEKLRQFISEDKRAFAAESLAVGGKIKNLEEKKNSITEKYITLQSEIKAGESRIEYKNRLIKEKEGELGEIKKKLSEDTGLEDVKKLKEEEKGAQAETAKAEKRLEEAEKKISAIVKEGQAQRDEMIKLQQRSHELQMEYNNSAGHLSDIKINKAKIEIKIEDLENEIRGETGGLRAIIDFKNFSPPLGQIEAKERIQKLKHQLELIGGIDPEAKKEYEEARARYEFLSNQSLDLRSGINSLEKIINELDKTIAEKFDAAFNQIASQFERYFKILFNGGSAKIIKVMSPLASSDAGTAADKEDAAPEEIEAPFDKKKKGPVLRKQKEILSGIEIQVCPPGKKIKSITMLSGGERALTAIALICAIISVNPSPFVVLDEVDAALDEANSGRLSKILKELSHKTQFIVITHNRSMMYIADIIYGVTMGNDSVSKLLSIKIDEAENAK